MVGDLFHYGHMRFLQKVRSSAQIQFPNHTIRIIVGVTADIHLAAYKRQPVTSNAERVETIAGCKFVDHVIPNVPLITSAEFMDTHHIDCVYHGDDYSEESKNKYYKDVLERKAYYSVGYSSDAVSTTTLLKTAAARHLSYLAKQAQQRQQTTALISKEIVTGFTFRKYTAPFLDNTEADRLLELLHLYGPHYQHEFAVDMKHRLYQQNVSSKNEPSKNEPSKNEPSKNESSRIESSRIESSSDGMFGRAAYCVASDANTALRNECVSHCCIIHNKNYHFGLFGNVITDPKYRRRGLSTRLVQDVLKDWDDINGGYLLLGTGSPYAAQTYLKNGFVHLAGGLDKGVKGYNPDDLGEWIMIRPPSSSTLSTPSTPSTSSGPGNLLLTTGTRRVSISKQEWKNTILVDINQRTQEYTGLNNNLVFNRQEFIKMYYFNSLGNELTAEQLSLVPLQRSHWPELCLLFNLDDGKNEMEKLLSRGITNGIQIEEKMLKLINQTEKETMEKKLETKLPMVCIDMCNERVYGIAVWDESKKEKDVYTLPGMNVVRDLLN